MKIRQEFSVTRKGWSRWIRPVMTGYIMACCDCDLVHEVDFRVVKNGKRVEMRVRRDERLTRKERRK